MAFFMSGREGRNQRLAAEKKSRKRWLKAELHAHCNLDPVDCRVCSFSPEQLISRAAGLGYEVLSFTCHDSDIWTEGLADYARKLGITLIPGMEVEVEGAGHVLVYNFRTGPENLNTLEKLRKRLRPDTLVVAAHPFFPGHTRLGKLLERNIDLFDAYEYSGFHIRGVNFNRRAVALAAKTGKPLVGCGDVHYFYQLNRTFTWIYAEPDPRSIMDAVRQGRVKTESSPLSWTQAAAWWATDMWRRLFPANVVPSESPVGKLYPARH